LKNATGNHEISCISQEEIDTQFFFANIGEGYLPALSPWYSGMMNSNRLWFAHRQNSTNGIGLIVTES